MRLIFLIIALLSSGTPVFAQTKQGPPVPAGFCISQDEMKLFNMVNEYRRRYDLPPIPLSRSLCYVASTHVKDLFLNHPDQEPCNFHSWSDKGTWKPFCYPQDETKKNSVWDKPKELTTYKGKGFEIVYWENNAIVIDSIIQFWRSIPYFNSFLMNTGKWQDKKWNAIGIAIYENYASAWFGEPTDTEETPYVCGEQPVNQKNPAPAKKDPQATVKSVVEQPAPVTPAPVTAGKYYIIVKSQVTLDMAKKAVTELKAKGYTNVRIIDRDNKIRVSVGEFSIKEEADNTLREVRKTYKDAWLLKL